MRGLEHQFAELERTSDPEQVVAVALDGAPLWLRAGTIDCHILRRAYIDDQYGVRHTAGGVVAVDVGAHIGVVTRMLAARYQRVLAFEPEPANLALLRRNVAGLPGVEVVEAAVAQAAGTLELQRSPTNTGGHSAFKSNRFRGGGTAVAEAVSLSAVLGARAMGCVDLLKMDAEGAEYGIVEDLRAAGLLGRIRSAVLEYHPTDPVPGLASDGAGLARLLEREGFTVRTEPDRQDPRYGLLRAVIA